MRSVTMNTRSEAMSLSQLRPQIFCVMYVWVSGSVTVLCEDGCFERARWIPCILFAEALWDTSLSDGELIRRAALCRDAVFA